MPWQVKRDSRCPTAKPVAVVREADNVIEGCHPNELMAQRQQAALYASNPSEAHKRPAKGG